MSLSYRKTRQGAWVAFGPVADLALGPVTVTTKAGQAKSETVVRLGSPFDVGGVPHAYGYLAPRQAPAYAGSGRGNTPTGRSAARRGCGCDDDCCARGRCRCDSTCNCRGGNIYDC
jgi:hypothetical protein